MPLAAGAEVDGLPEEYSDDPEVVDILKEHQVRLGESLEAEVSAPGPAGRFHADQHVHPCMRLPSQHHGWEFPVLQHLYTVCGVAFMITFPGEEEMELNLQQAAS